MLAYYLQQYCPWVKFCILERRQNLGGTWDFFKYPGIRSDSDMYTFGFSWKIWKAENPIATADQILDYLKEAVREQNLVEKIRFGVNVKSASFSSSSAMWTLQTDSWRKVHMQHAVRLHRLLFLRAAEQTGVSRGGELQRSYSSSLRVDPRT